MMRFFTIILFFGLINSTNTQDRCLSDISSDNLMTSVRYLSSPDLQGRLSGSQTYNIAAQWVADHFKKYNLKPLEKDSYFQKFNLPYNQITTPCQVNYIWGNDTINYGLPNDYVWRGFTGSGDVQSELVFCGYGISQPQRGYDDYANMYVKDKAVVIFKQNPSWTLDSLGWNEIGLRKKVEFAVNHGARAVIYISLPKDKHPQKPIGSVMEGEGLHFGDIPQLHISLDAAYRWFKNAGLNIHALQSEIDVHKKPQSENLNGTIKIIVNTHYYPSTETMNVAAYLEGTTLKEEYIIIGAHLDHVGAQCNEIYFPGANDNASGVASVVELARTISQCPYKPKRSIVFVTFAAEESGLEGSRYFVEHLPIDKNKIIAMLNMDCIGVGDSIIVGSGLSNPNLYAKIVEIDDSLDNLMTKQTWKGGGADAEAFHKARIPTLYFVSKNSYPHLHLTTDTPETLNNQLHLKISRLVCALTDYLSSGSYIKEQPIMNE